MGTVPSGTWQVADVWLNTRPDCGASHWVGRGYQSAWDSSTAHNAQYTTLLSEATLEEQARRAFDQRYATVAEVKADVAGRFWVQTTLNRGFVVRCARVVTPLCVPADYYGGFSFCLERLEPSSGTYEEVGCGTLDEGFVLSSDPNRPTRHFVLLRAEQPPPPPPYCADNCIWASDGDCGMRPRPVSPPHTKGQLHRARARRPGPAAALDD